MIAVDDAVKSQHAVVKQRSLDFGELWVDYVAAFDDSNLANKRYAITEVRKVAKRALKAMKDCGGIKKLEDAPRHLRIKERFNVNVQPPALPESPDEMFEFLGVPKALHNAAYASRISFQWKAHRAAWKPRAEDAPRSRRCRYTTTGRALSRRLRSCRRWDATTGAALSPAPVSSACTQR